MFINYDRLFECLMLSKVHKHFHIARLLITQSICSWAFCLSNVQFFVWENRWDKLLKHHKIPLPYQDNLIRMTTLFFCVCVCVFFCFLFFFFVVFFIYSLPLIHCKSLLVRPCTNNDRWKVLRNAEQTH